MPVGFSGGVDDIAMPVQVGPESVEEDKTELQVFRLCKRKKKKEEIHNRAQEGGRQKGRFSHLIKKEGIGTTE